MNNLRTRYAVGALVVVIGLGWYFTKSQQDVADNHIGSSTSTESLEYENDEYKQYREKTKQALELQRNTSFTETEQTSWKKFESEKYGFDFRYPDGYLVTGEEELNPSENAGALFSYSLIQDNARNRRFLDGGMNDAETPASISVIVYPKDAARTDLSKWVPSIITSEEKEVSGIYERTTVFDQEALIYTSSTMYEYDSVITSKGNYVYNFSVGFITPDDDIRKNFYKLLSTVTFK